MSIYTRFFSIAVVVLIGVTGCASPSKLVLHTDPVGADVQEAKLGFLGQSPLTREFSTKELQRLSVPMTLNLEISKKGYIPEKMTVSLPADGGEYQVKRQLLERLSYIDITSEPDGVAVFLEFIPTQTYQQADPSAREKMRDAQKNDVVKRFLGNTPIRYQDDPEHPLEEGDYLIFKKAGYKDNEALFRLKEKRLHLVMDPLISKER